MANKKNDHNNTNDDFDTFMKNFLSSFKDFFNDDFFKMPIINFDKFNDSQLQQKLREGPVYWGYSTIIGPDGKPVTKVWDNITPPKDLNLHENNIQQLEPENIENTSEEPFIDIIEDEDQLRILAELPGVTKENIILKVKNNNLILSAHSEMHTYTKEIPLDIKIDPKSIKTQYNNGVLEIQLPTSKKIKNNDTGFDVKID